MSYLPYNLRIRYLIVDSRIEGRRNNDRLRNVANLEKITQNKEADRKTKERTK